jgi:hypothetical protein
MYLLNSRQSIFHLQSQLSFRMDKSVPCLIWDISVFLDNRYIDSAGFTGPLPSSLSKLTNMRTLYAYSLRVVDIIMFHTIQSYVLFFFSMFRWASDNDFTGLIPDYIGSWTNLTEL